MASVDNVPLASLGTHRTRAGAVTQSGQPEQPPAEYGGSAVEDYHAVPPLLPVSHRQQASVLVTSFLAIALSIGYNQCYGVFQEYYLSADQDVLVHAASGSGQPSAALLAFVGTLGAGLTWAGSIVVNPWLSRVEHAATAAPGPSRRHQTRSASAAAAIRSAVLSPRGITVAGVALMALGFLLASFCTQVWQLLLTQGLLYGVGSSMLYFPLLGPAPEYFTRHRATAIGLILSGGGVGSLVLATAVRALLSAVGGRWTLRVIAAIDLAVGLPVAWAVPGSRFPATARRRTHVSAALLATPAFGLSVAAAFCQSASAQPPLTFIPSYSVALGLSAGTGATLLAVANAVNAAARIATGYAGDRFGRLNVLFVSLGAAAITVGALWGLSVSKSSSVSSSIPASSLSTSTQLWLAFIVLYSAAAGGYYALFPATIADVFGIRSYAAVNGFIYFIRGCGTMLSSPIGGVLLGSGRDASSSAPYSPSAPSGAYADVIVWDMALMIGSVVCILGVRWADALRRGWMWRA